MLEISELQSLIIEWAKEKNINNPDNQYLKILEEVGETARAILKNDIPEIKDGIGDIAVTVIIYYWQNEEKLMNEYFDRINAKDNFCFEIILSDIYTYNTSALDGLFELAKNHNTTLKECLNLAWNVIKDRQGKTLNGTFIKN